MNLALYKKELKGSFKLLLVFAAILTMYISMIINMYDPKLYEALNQFQKWMPQIMSALGMSGTNDTLGGFMSSYLYGMILLVFPMVYSIIRANGLIAKHVDKGSMASLLSAPVTRTRIVCTQLWVLVSGIFLLILYCTILEYTVAEIMFPGELPLTSLLPLNAGLLCLQLFIGGLCFFCSCVFNETKYSIAAGAGITVLMFLVHMLANMGGKLENLKYLTFFTLFNPDNLLAGEPEAIVASFVLFIFAILLFYFAVFIFKKKDLYV